MDNNVMYCEVGELGASVEIWLRKHGRSIRPKLTQEQVEELTACFSIFDSDGSGEVDADEVHGAMRMLGLHSTKKEVHDMMGDWDNDGSGRLELPEFIEMMTARMDRQRLEQEQEEEQGKNKVDLQSFARALRRRNIIAEMMKGNYDNGTLARLMAPSSYAQMAAKQKRQSRVTIIPTAGMGPLLGPGSLIASRGSKLVEMGLLPPAEGGKAFLPSTPESRPVPGGYWDTPQGMAAGRGSMRPSFSPSSAGSSTDRRVGFAPSPLSSPNSQTSRGRLESGNFGSPKAPVPIAGRESPTGGDQLVYFPKLHHSPHLKGYKSYSGVHEDGTPMAPRSAPAGVKFGPRKPSGSAGSASPRAVAFSGFQPQPPGSAGSMVGGMGGGMQPALFGGSRGVKGIDTGGSNSKWARRAYGDDSDDEDEETQVLAFDKKLFSKGVLEDMLRPNGATREKLTGSAVVFQPKPNPRKRYVE